MGSYSSFYIGQRYINSVKNGVGLESLLFHEDEFYRIQKPWGSEGESDLNGYIYYSEVSQIKDRLFLMGYSKALAQKTYRKALKQKIKFIQMQMRSSPKYKYLWEDDLDTFCNYPDFEEWLWIALEIIKNKVPIIYDYKKNDEKYKDLDRAYVKMLSGDWSETLGFSIIEDSDHRYFTEFLVYYSLLDHLSPDFPVVLDVWGLFYGDREFNCNLPQVAVIVTEGKTDLNILKHSLDILYPHLSPMIQFIDFDSTNMQGGTGQIINIMKILAATGVKTNTIAILDNDTAGHDALRCLDKLKLPSNLKAICLPDIKKRSRYPTEGPQGKKCLNINKIACSIELYLGDFLLKNTEDQMLPVKFSGYISSMSRWQGEIMGKNVIYERFLTHI